MKPPKNNLYTVGYFRNRLRTVGIHSKILFNKFKEDDKRYWIISIFDDLNIICICKRDFDNEFIFEFSDSKQKIQNTTSIKTKSFQEILNFLLTLVN
jgi:hypothetical protein